MDAATHEEFEFNRITCVRPEVKQRLNINSPREPEQ
jgi:hypothetical protein